MNFEKSFIKISCYDEDLISNDRIGENIFKLADIVSQDGEYKRAWHPILFKKKKSGDIYLECRLLAEHQKTMPEGGTLKN